MNGLLGVFTNLAIPLATVVVTLAGLWLAHNYQRQMALRLSDIRRTAYAHLWEITGIAAPTRLDASGTKGYLTPEERRALWIAMTDWYYSNGNGMLLSESTKRLYLNVKHNLTCRPTDLKPSGLRGVMFKGREHHSLTNQDRGIMSIKQISLLRTKLKSDLEVYGPTYSENLDMHEIFFLAASGVDVRSKPWVEASGSRPRFRYLRDKVAHYGAAVLIRPSPKLQLVEQCYNEIERQRRKHEMKKDSRYQGGKCSRDEMKRDCKYAEENDAPWYAPRRKLVVDRDDALPKFVSQAVMKERTATWACGATTTAIRDA